MKHLTAILVIAAVLLTPASASAIERPSGSICDTHSGKQFNCFDAVDTDTYRHSIAESGVYPSWANFLPATGTYQMGQGGCFYAYHDKDAWIQNGSPKTPNTCVPVMTQAVGHEVDKYLFADIPAADRDGRNAMGLSLPWVSQLVIVDSYGEGVFIRRREVWVLTNPADPNVIHERYCQYYTKYDSNAGPTKYALDTTPTSVYDACRASGHYVSRWSDRPQTTDPVVAPPSGAITVPAGAARCGTTSGVVVRSTRVLCAPARTVMGRYARSLRSPAGWSCRMVINDRGRRGSCVRKHQAKSGKVARATIYGIWLNR